jgi:hypothetical protein
MLGRGGRRRATSEGRRAMEGLACGGKVTGPERPCLQGGDGAGGSDRRRRRFFFGGRGSSGGFLVAGTERRRNRCGVWPAGKRYGEGEARPAAVDCGAAFAFSLGNRHGGIAGITSGDIPLGLEELGAHNTYPVFGVCVLVGVWGLGVSHRGVWFWGLEARPCSDRRWRRFLGLRVWGLSLRLWRW